MIYYHCDGCQKRQAPGNTACWNCRLEFPRPVPFERPLVVVVDKETLEYTVYDGEGHINMHSVPSRPIRKQMRKDLNAAMREYRKTPGKSQFRSPSDYMALAFGIACGVGLIVFLCHPAIVIGR